MRCRSYEETARKSIGLRGEQAVLVAQFGKVASILFATPCVKRTPFLHQAYDFGSAAVYLIIVGDTGVALLHNVGFDFVGLRQLVRTFP